MSTIVIAPLQELGHILPTLQMAKALSRRGHRVVYVGIEDHRATIEAEGFEYVALFRDALPMGFVAAQGERVRRRRIPALVLAEDRRWRRIAEAELLRGREDRRLRDLAADLFLVDAEWEDATLAIERLGGRVVSIRTTLTAAVRSFGVDPEVPPPSSTKTSGRFGLAWRVHHAREIGLWALSHAMHGGARRFVEVLAARRARSEEPHRCLVLCPEELDFPRARRHPHVRHCGPSIDLDRREAPLDLPSDAGKPLVYCAVGSQGQRARHHIGVLRAVLEACRRERAWRLVMSIGDHVDVASLGEVPEGSLVARRVPQLRVLATASAAIVHGGLGTIKECIWFRVPMLVVPGAFDQPSNGGRVALHGLGLVRAARDLDSGAIAEIVRSLLDDDARRDRLAAFATRFAEIEREERHVACIEEELRR
jgi:MGT family glycosyltransferase